jgi:hypothetical protein
MITDAKNYLAGAIAESFAGGAAQARRGKLRAQVYKRSRYIESALKRIAGLGES